MIKKADNPTSGKILKLSAQHFIVESSDNTIFYKVSINSSNCFCTCHDFSFNSKRSPGYKCKHISAVMEAKEKEIIQAEYLSKSQFDLDERYIKKLDGKEFVLYQGLLDLSHQKGLKKLSVQLLQFPSEGNGREVVCLATAETHSGAIFSDIGDANPGNTDSSIAPHLIRMASTRAKARALRDMNNIGMTALEELGSDAFKAGNGSRNNKNRPSGSKPQDPEKKAGGGNGGTSRSTKAMSEAQRNAINNLARRRKLTEEALAELIKQETGKNPDKLTSPEASRIIQQLTKAQAA